MFPYRFDDHSTGQPAAPAPPTTSAPKPSGRKGRIGTASLLLLALGAGVVGGGTAGTLAAGQWLEPRSAPSTAAPAPLTIQNTPQAQATPSANVAGAVFGSVSASVVRVTSSGEARGGLTPEGSGSGFVVDSSGLILTNNHVVAQANSVSVRFSSGEERPAEVVGTDRGNDLALLQVDLPANVPAITLGDSDQVAVGETAIAIGSPFGLDQSVTQGIVSAIDRTWSGGYGRAQRDLIQTDAPINPGNSGGPLLNARGEVIGINTMIESPVRGNVGVGFAVPINTARQLLPQLQAGAQLEPVWLGISAQPDPATPQAGLTITQVVRNSAAAQADLQPGDVLTAVNGNQVNDLSQLSEQLATFQPGDRVTLTLTRNGQAQQVDVTLQPWPETIE